eukprot:g44377.t1
MSAAKRKSTKQGEEGPPLKRQELESLKKELEPASPLVEPKSVVQAEASEGTSARGAAKFAQLPAAYDVHVKARPSLLSSTAKDVDFRGFYNLAGIFMVVLNLRLVVENILKYGWLVGKVDVLIGEPWRTWPCLISSVVIPMMHPFIAYLIELSACKFHLSRALVAYVHTAHLLSMFIWPTLLIHTSDSGIGAGFVCLISCLLTFFKLGSHAHVCNHLRKTDQELNAEGQPVPKGKPYYPSLAHLYFFIAAPTLCFQLQYPRTERIRKKFVMRRIAEIIFCSSLITFIAQQWVLPTLQNSIPLIEAGDFFHLFERILKLSVPNACIWLLSFYVIFHSTLNLCAELLRFADREFYKDWWNSPNLGTFWRWWNLPVHNWFVRHFYAPAIRHGWTPLQAQLFVFFVSALLHEVIVSVPCHTFRLYVFVAMLSQAPLASITAMMRKDGVWGNVIFWCVFLAFGQPSLILIYAYDVVLYEKRLASSPS